MIINGYKTKAAALRDVNTWLESQGLSRISGLLAAPDANPKIAKNGKVDVMTAPMHLAPASLSGFNVCAQASKGCIIACLHKAGNPAYMVQKELSRIAKTRAFFGIRKAFMAVLFFEIAALERKAKKAGMQCAVRLNATSDIPWEKMRANVNRAAYSGKLALRADGVMQSPFEAFPDVRFYDYTAITKRAVAFGRGKMPANYHLTFSRKEDNDAACIDVLNAGGNVAVVFEKSVYNLAMIAVKTDYKFGFPGFEPRAIVDGDAHDYRPLDGQKASGQIVALKAKGDARNDTSGFVVR